MVDKRSGSRLLFLLAVSATSILGCGDTAPPPAPSNPPPVPAGQVDPGPPTAVPPAKK